jgi:hypothetical protein
VHIKEAAQAILDMIRLPFSCPGFQGRADDSTIKPPVLFRSFTAFRTHATWYQFFLLVRAL